ncbi:TPA: hypothetical protein HA297_06720 [Candidatus Woesearchaeota archaeon]|nr:hypothetical protein [Candidatus Woesearchaeota archaeon]
MLFCRRGTARYTVLIVLIVAVVGIILVTSNANITGNATKEKQKLKKLSKAVLNCKTAQGNYKRCMDAQPVFTPDSCDAELNTLKTLRCKVPSLQPRCQQGAVRNTEYCPDGQTVTRRNICTNGRWTWETVLPAEQCPQPEQAPAPEEPGAQEQAGQEQPAEQPQEAQPPIAEAQQRPAPQPDTCRYEESFTTRNEQRCPETGTIYRWQICTLDGRWVWEDIPGVVCAGNQQQQAPQQEQPQQGQQQEQPQQEQQPAPQQRQQDLAREGQACSRQGDCAAGLVCYEVWPGFSECKRDTDGDGVIDDDERAFETDPNNPASNPNDRDGDGTANANDATPCGQHATFPTDRCTCDAGWSNSDGTWNTGCEAEVREHQGIYFDR